MGFDEQLEATQRAPRFVAWLLTTQRLQPNATVIVDADLRLGIAARRWNPSGHAWFVEACAPLRLAVDDVALQWSTLAKITAVMGAAAEPQRRPSPPGRRTETVCNRRHRGMQP